MAYITKRGRKWQVRIRLKRRSLSRQFIKKSDATAWAQETEYKITKEEYVDMGKLNTIKLSELLWLYYEKTKHTTKWQKRFEHEVNNLMRFSISNLFLTELSSQVLAEFRDDQLKNGKSPSTVKKYLSLISRAINKGKKEMGIPIVYNPVLHIEKPKEPIGRSRVLSDEEFHRLLKASGLSHLYYLKDLIIFAYETLMRQGEILKLKRSDVDFSKNTIYIEETKNGHPRTIGASDIAIDILKGLPRTTDDRFFPVKSRASLNHALKRAFEKADIKNFRFHDLRHMGATRLSQDGWNVQELKAQGGWLDIRMLSRYTHIQGEHLAKRLRG